MRVRSELLLDPGDLRLNSHVLSIVEHLVVELLLSEARSVRLGSWQGRHKRIHHVLLICVQVGNAHVDHIVVCDANLIELSCVYSQHSLGEKQLLPFNLYL